VADLTLAVAELFAPAPREIRSRCVGRPTACACDARGDVTPRRSPGVVAPGGPASRSRARPESSGSGTLDAIRHVFWSRQSITEKVRPMRSERCWFCGSRDTDTPYSKPSRIAVLSWLFPRLARRFCRACGRHFWTIQSKNRSRRRYIVSDRREVGEGDDDAAWYRAVAPTVGGIRTARRDRERV